MFYFSKADRLIHQHEFQSVFAKTTYKIKHKYLLALAKQSPDARVRLGMVINKRLVKRAIDRNLIKRIIRESFRHHKESVKGLDIIVLLRSECTPLDKQLLRVDVDHLWRGLANSLKPV